MGKLARYLEKHFSLSSDYKREAEFVEAAWGTGARVLYETYFAPENPPPLPPDNVIKAMGEGAWHFMRDLRRV